MSVPKHGVSRRTFLRAATLGIASAAVPLVSTEGARAATAATTRTSMPTLTRSSFAPHLHRSFRVTAADGRAFSATLVEVSDLVGVPTQGDEGRFSLLFRARPHPHARHGIHELSRASFGSLDLFVVPVGRGVDHQHYQAVVNRPA